MTTKSKRALKRLNFRASPVASKEANPLNHTKQKIWSNLRVSSWIVLC
jgi:hypothetical protein